MRHAILTSISTLLFAVALAFLILVNVSVPVSTSLHLASSLTYTFGIFGYCDGDLCLSAGYPVLFGDIDTSSSWVFSTTTRNTLSKTFIVAPIAAGFTFLAFSFTLLSIFVHASALKILSLIFGVLALVSSALIAVMVILVFHPHVDWLGWLLVASAACCVVAAPILLLSISVPEDADADTDTDEYGVHKFGDISNMDHHRGYSAGSMNDIKDNQYGYAVNTASDSKEFSYRAPNNAEYLGDKTDALSKSLLEATPNMANDVTKPQPYMTSGPVSSTNSFQHAFTNVPSGPGSSVDSFQQKAYTSLSIQSGPSTPIASNRHLAPAVVPSEGTTHIIEQPMLAPPYPQKDRASSIYDLRNYGVFDHHPTVEGHQPFTELQDTDNADQESEGLDLPENSDGESDFTSVSQRPPNESYVPQQPMQQAPPPQSHQTSLPYQPYSASQFSARLQMNGAPVAHYTESAQNMGSHPMQNMRSAPRQNMGPAFNQGYGQPNTSQSYGQHHAYQPQYQSPSAPRPTNQPTISDNALNNNPDFAIGFASRSKKPGRPAYPAQPPGSGLGVAFTPRTTQREGRYGV